MRVPSARVIALALLLAGAGATLLVVLLSAGGSTPRPSGELVAVQRGDISVTVGGIGHVTSLAGAARAAVPASAGAGAGSSASGPSSKTTASGGAGGGPREVPLDAVFPAVAGHVTDVLVSPGQKVLAGQPIAKLADDGTLAGAMLGARNDLSTAQLELAQKRLNDPARGLAPTGAERAAADAGVLAARAKLHSVLAGSTSAEVAAARAELAKAQAEAASSAAAGPAALQTAQIAVEGAQAKLATVTGSPDPVDIAGAKLEVAKATVEQQSLLSAVERPTDAARSAAQLAVDAARAKLDALLRPPAPVVDAARQELAKARAELETQRAANGAVALAASRAALQAARRKLQQLKAAPTAEALSTARSDLRKSQADLAVLRQRGAPASSIDLALAQLKVDVAAQRVALERQLASRLLVRASSAGTVTSVLTTTGAGADPTTPIARVQDLDHLVVTVDLSEYDVGRVRLGAPADISVEALGGRRLAGKVSDVSPSGTENGGVVNFPVTIGLDRSAGPRPGMSVSARIIIQRARNVLRVPASAVHEGDQPSVTLSGPSGRLVNRPVELGLRSSAYVEVTNGLKAGDRVLVPSSGA